MNHEDNSYKRHLRDDDANPSIEVSEEELEVLKTESDVLGGDEVTQAERLFKENLPGSVLQLVKLATHAQSERVRLDASKYIVERNLGRLQDINPSAAKQPLEAFFDRLEDEEEDA